MKLQHALLALFLCLSTGAEARVDFFHQPVGRNNRHIAALDARPHAWCGWWMRHQVGRDPGLQFNLARAWAGYGYAAPGPSPGVIGVLPHHVFKVVAVLDRGIVLAISGNDGHAVRTRPRSIAGVIAWRRL